MEHVDEPQPPINLSQFLDEYKEKLSNPNVPFYLATHSPLSPTEDTSWLQRLDTPDDSSIILTLLPGEVQRESLIWPQMDREVPRTYTVLMEKKKKSRRNPFTPIQYGYRQSMTDSMHNDKKDNVNFVALEEFMLKITVRVYRPPRASHRGYKVESPVFHEEFECLGSNYLSELRDKISCVCDGRKFVEISEDPEAPLPKLDTDPAYFYINNTFYNDTRNPNNCDYSKTVSNWARNAEGMQHEQFQFASMESTRFIELTCSLGSPMHYLHHGNCEHLFTFSQVEVLVPHKHKSTFLNRSLYPFMRARSAYNRRCCNLCSKNSFVFIVEKSNKHLDDPAYLCRSCFYSFHYVDGKKVGQFKAYRIYDRVEGEDESECQPQDNEQEDNEQEDNEQEDNEQEDNEQEDKDPQDKEQQDNSSDECMDLN